MLKNLSVNNTMLTGLSITLKQLLASQSIATECILSKASRERCRYPESDLIQQTCEGRIAQHLSKLTMNSAAT